MEQRQVAEKRPTLGNNLLKLVYLCLVESFCSLFRDFYICILIVIPDEERNLHRCGLIHLEED